MAIYVSITHFMLPWIYEENSFLAWLPVNRESGFDKTLLFTKQPSQAYILYVHYSPVPVRMSSEHTEPRRPAL